jgi:hypothetical protein
MRGDYRLVETFQWNVSDIAYGYSKARFAPAANARA